MPRGYVTSDLNVKNKIGHVIQLMYQDKIKISYDYLENL